MYEPAAETMPREQLDSLQTERLRSLIEDAKARVTLYGERLSDVEPADVSSLDDLRGLPFTRKRTCAIRTRSGCSGSDATSSPASMPRRARRGSSPSSATQPPTSTSSHASTPATLPWRAPSRA